MPLGTDLYCTSSAAIITVQQAFEKLPHSLLKGIVLQSDGVKYPVSDRNIGDELFSGKMW